MKINKLLLILLMIISTLLILISTSNAALQSNGGTTTSYDIENWLKNIRNMETTGGTLGLNAAIDETTLLDTSTSNNLDIHMEKNTEYGAMAILSVSSYGNPNIIADGETTTGNSTGVVIKINKEWVSGGLERLDVETFKNMDGRYKNIYTTDKSSVKKGDATYETKEWHGSAFGVKDNEETQWFGGYHAGNPGMVRAYSGAIFSLYLVEYARWDVWDTCARHTNKHASRAVVVVGEGI